MDVESNIEPIRRRRRHNILFHGCYPLISYIFSSICELLHKCMKTEAFSVVLEIVSLILAVVGKNKWDFLLASCFVSLLACVTIIIVYAKRGTSVPANQLAEKILMVVDIGFTVIQFISTLMYFALAVLHVQIGFKESLLPLFYVSTRCVFLYIARRQRVTQTSGDSPMVDGIALIGISESINYFTPTSQMSRADSVANNDNHLPNDEATSSSSCEPPVSLSSDSMPVDPGPIGSTTSDIREGPGLAPQMPQTDNEAEGDDQSPKSKFPCLLMAFSIPIHRIANTFNQH